jgi:hypothetical protein
MYKIETFLHNCVSYKKISFDFLFFLPLAFVVFISNNHVLSWYCGDCVLLIG